MRKKFLSLILALCMVMSLLHMTAFAAAPTGLTVSTNPVDSTAVNGEVVLTITMTPADSDTSSGKLLYKVVDAVADTESGE